MIHNESAREQLREAPLTSPCDLDELATFVTRADQTDALREYRDALRRRGS